MLEHSSYIEINPGPILPNALMMRELELFDSRIKILHQNARSLAGQHLLLKEPTQDIGYNCICAFSETWLSQNHPEEFWHVDMQKMFLEKIILGIDLAMAEGKSVIIVGDYNLNYIAKRDRSQLQSVVSPYELKPSKFGYSYKND